MKLAIFKLYTVSFHMVGLYAVWAFKNKKSYCVLPHVASNFSKQNRIRHVAPNLLDRVSQA